jgi:hypothetical protein
VNAALNSPDGCQLTVGERHWRLRFGAGVEVTVAAGHVSPSYGVSHPAQIIEYRFAATPGCGASFTIERAN